MHYLKRIVYLLIAIITVSSLTSCRNDKTKNLLIVCQENAEPFAYRDSDGELTGFEIELIKAIALDQGFNVKLVPMEFSEIMKQFKKKVPKLDGAMSLITWTTERWAKMEFTHPYFKSSIAAAVKSGQKGINSIDDLQGKKVTCKKGTFIDEYAQLLRDSIGFTLTTYDKLDDAFASVTNGTSDVILEEYPLIYYRINTQKMPLDIAFQGMDQFTFNAAVKKTENYSFIRMFNDGLYNLQKNGTYKSIFDKYFRGYPYHI